MLAPLVLCCAIAFAPEAAPREDAEALYESGQAKYETHDYAGAIADFTAAYNLALELDDETMRDEVLARLAYNLARAHVSAYDVDADRSHLELARRLLADYRGHERQMGRDPDADTDLKLLEAELLTRERALASGEPDEDPDEVDEPIARPELEPVRHERPGARSKRRAGVAMLAITPAFAGLAIAGGVMALQARDDFEAATTGGARLDARQSGQLGDTLLGVGIGLAAASAITGVALVVSGRVRDRQLVLRVRPNGLALEGRF